MTRKIDVAPSAEGTYQVRVTEDKSRSSHTVTLKDSDYARISGGAIAREEFIRRSFEFLLEHEPKESILSRFDLMLISRYFPQYESEIKKRLA